jgi:hypothetical protein
MNQSIIYNDPTTGVCAVVRPSTSWTGTIEELAAKDVPNAVPFDIVDDTVLKPDRTFRNAWRKGTGAIDVDMPAARNIAHDRRRIKREELMKPHDDVIMKQIPGQNAAAAKAARAKIRTDDAVVQSDIDSAADEASLKAILTNYGV